MKITSSGEVIMICRKILIFWLVAGLITTVATCDGASPLQEKTQPVRRDFSETSPTDSKPQQMGQSASSIDFPNVNLLTPKKAVISFIDLFNGITPVATLTELQGICTKVVVSSYQKECMTLLESRLSYVKSAAKNLKGAYFIPQSMDQVDETPLKYNASWQEKLTYVDGPTKLTNSAMLVSLEKSGDEWRILRVEKYSVHGLE